MGCIWVSGWQGTPCASICAAGRFSFVCLLLLKTQQRE
jgi:hypothetical protein